MTPPPTILVVDDDPAVLQVLTETLQDAGYAVCQAENGLTALHAIETHPPDLVLSDVKMPLLDGVELAAHLARRSQPIPAILMSADDHVPAGCAAPFLAKPFALPQLLALVARVLTMPLVLAAALVLV